MGINKKFLPRTGGKELPARKRTIKSPPRLRPTPKPPGDEFLLKIEAIIRHTFRQIIAWGNEICPHFRAYPMKKRECTICWGELGKAAGE